MRRLICGNGIVGLSVAFGLIQRGPNDQVVVVGKTSRPGSATLAAGAMLNSFAEIEEGGLVHEVDLLRFEMSHRATRLWPAFELALIEAAGKQIPSGCSKCLGCEGGGCFSTGTYVVNNTAADDLDDRNFDAIIAALESFNEQHDHISPQDIPGYKPMQRTRATRAVLIHGEGWFNPRLMVEKLEAALRRSGQVEFVNASVDALEQSGDLIARLRLDDGTYLEADQYLLATGASVSDVLNQSNINVDIQRVFFGIGTSIEIRSTDAPLTHVIRTPNRGLACGLYGVPYYQGPDKPNDHILIGASNLVAPELHSHGRLASIEGLLSGAIHQINSDFYRAELVSVNVGARPTSQDTYPLLGGTRIKNLFVATGTKRDGFHLAPVISEFITDVMHGVALDPRYEIFRPDRAPLRILSRQEAIQKAIRHQTSAAFQHGFEPPTSRMPEQIDQHFRDALERLHDQVGAKDWGIPPEMLDMYRYGHARA